MPFITPALIDEQLLFRRHDHDVVVPLLDGKLQPSCAVYSRDCVQALTCRVRRGERSIADFIESKPESRVCRLGGQSLSRIAIIPHCLMDIDSPEGLAREKRVLA